MDLFQIWQKLFFSYDNRLLNKCHNYWLHKICSLKVGYSWKGFHGVELVQLFNIVGTSERQNGG